MKRKIGLIGKLIALIFAVYAVMLMVSLQAQINEKTAEGQALEKKLQTQAMINAALQEDIGSESNETQDQRMERLAREQIGLLMPGEVIIVNKTP